MSQLARIDVKGDNRLMCEILFLILLTGKPSAKTETTIPDVVSSLMTVTPGSGKNDFASESSAMDSIGQAIERQLDMESGSIAKGFRDIASRIDQDFVKSGERSFHKIQESLKAHAEMLQDQFKEMAEEIRKGFDRFADVDQMLPSEKESSSNVARDKTNTGTNNVFSSDFWRNIFS